MATQITSPHLPALATRPAVPPCGCARRSLRNLRVLQQESVTDYRPEMTLARSHGTRNGIDWDNLPETTAVTTLPRQQQHHWP